METRAVWPVLELRQEGRTLLGRFPYRQQATIRDKGRVRRERFEPGAFSFAIEDEGRDIHLLSGHSFDRPLASRAGGSLEIEDSSEALTFRATLPPEGERPSWMEDTTRAMQAGLVGGVSPGFVVPTAVQDAEVLEPEPGNSGVMVRRIRAAVLYELSLVTRPAYTETEVDLRSDELVTVGRRRRVWL